MVDESTSVDLEPQHTLIVTRQQAKGHTHQHHDGSEAHHPKDQKVGRAQFLETFAPS